MDRRRFIKTTSLAAAGAVAGSAGHAAAASNAAKSKPAVPAILATFDAETHRRRLENIGRCERAIRGCLRKHLITDYLPGQCCYNLELPLGGRRGAPRRPGSRGGEEPSALRRAERRYEPGHHRR